MYVLQCTKSGYFDFYGFRLTSYSNYARKGQFIGGDAYDVGPVMCSSLNSKNVRLFPTRAEAEETRTDLRKCWEDGYRTAEFEVVKVERTVKLAA